MRSLRASLVLLLVGCVMLPATGPCLPEGVPPFAEWNLVALRPSGVCRTCRQALYEVGEVSLVVFWVGDLIGLIDPAPRDPTAPAWQDAGVVVPAGEFRVRAEPVQTCRWTRRDLGT